MGTESLTDKTDGNTIDQTWFNVIHAVLTGNLVPRNSSRIATTDEGSLGTNLLRWLNAYISASGKLYLGACELYQDSGDLKLSDGTNTITLLKLRNLLTASGLDGSAAHLGSFDNSFFTADQTIKEILQAIEDFYVEGLAGGLVSSGETSDTVTEAWTDLSTTTTPALNSIMSRAVSCYINFTFEAKGNFVDMEIRAISSYGEVMGDTVTVTSGSYVSKSIVGTKCLYSAETIHLQGRRTTSPSSGTLYLKTKNLSFKII